MSLRIDPEERELIALNQATDFRDREVLEVGCGDGRLTFLYGRWAKHVYAIDPDGSRVEAARKNTPLELLQKVEFQQAAIEHTDLPSEQFDICLLAWSL